MAVDIHIFFRFQTWEQNSDKKTSAQHVLPCKSQKNWWQLKAQQRNTLLLRAHFLLGASCSMAGFSKSPAMFFQEMLPHMLHSLALLLLKASFDACLEHFVARWWSGVRSSLVPGHPPSPQQPDLSHHQMKKLFTDRRCTLPEAGSFQRL